jgi:putative SOS response-associated peptidase YedK
MCGRFVVKSATEVIRDMFGDYEVIEQYAPNFNVAPGQQAPVLLKSRGQRQVRNLQWGLVPFFAKEPKTSFKTINARAETIHKLPSYRTPFRKRRCAVAADGFYEWRKLGKVKVPYYITLARGAPMLFAGVYDHWKRPQGGYLSTFSIATVAANAFMAQIHNDKKRMPAMLLTEEKVRAWVEDESEDPGTLQPLLASAPRNTLTAHVVRRDVGSPRNNRKELIDPVTAEYVGETYGEVPELV